MTPLEYWIIRFRGDDDSRVTLHCRRASRNGNSRIAETSVFAAEAITLQSDSAEIGSDRNAWRDGQTADGGGTDMASRHPRMMLLMLVAMTGVAPISLYMLVPALPVLATTFGRDISVAQMTVSLYMVGIACSQIIMGPLSDRFGRRPVLLAGLGLMVIASVGCIFAETLPQLIAARFLQALGGATGMVVSRAIIRDLYSRERISAMISLVIAVMMIAQMLSPLTGGLLETAFGWRSIFYRDHGGIADDRGLRSHWRCRKRAATAPKAADFAAMSAACSKAAPSSAMCCARCWPRRSSSPSPAAGPTSW